MSVPYPDAVCPVTSPSTTRTRGPSSIMGAPNCGGEVKKAHPGTLQSEPWHPKMLRQTQGDKDTKPLPFPGAAPQRRGDAVVVWWDQTWL